MERPTKALVTVPKVGSPRFMSGAKKLGWLAMLNTSARNSSFSFSLVGFHHFSSPTSLVFVPGARVLGRVRGALPKVYAAGCAKAAVLNHSWIVGFEMCGLPTSSGRWPRLPAPVLLTSAPIASGNPSLKVDIPDTCHPPTTA